MPLLKIATEQSLAFILSLIAVWIIKPTIGAGTLLLVAIVFALSNIVLQSAKWLLRRRAAVPAGRDG